MHFRHLLLVTTIFLYLPPNTDAATLPDNQEKMHLCGDYLATMLSELCHGRYNGPQGASSGKDTQKLPVNKIITMHAVTVNPVAEEGQLGYGIVEECCVEPCSRTELLTYCA